MSERGDSKITWITCPDCGAKIGVVLSVGKAVTPSEAPLPESTSTWPPAGINERLASAG
nr:hypothetical protein [Nitrososphaeria archaeon]